MNFIDSYKQLLRNSNILVDYEQEKFLIFLSEYQKSLKEFFTHKQDRFGFFKIAQKPKNLYLYGSVGIGKSLMIKSFVAKLITDSLLPAEKVMSMHLHQFLLMIHNKINMQRHKDRQNFLKNDILRSIVQDIAKSYSLIYLDEFAVNDIVDAMLIGKLLIELEEQKIIVLTSSNIEPKNLYKDGIQRESFLPTIKFIEKSYHQYHLSSTQDYRALKENNKTVIKIISTEIEAEVYMISLLSFMGIKHLEIKELHFLGRSLLVKRCYKNVAIFTFEELFEQELANPDYEQITNNFQVIFIEKIRQIKADEKNILRRFINFIDIVFEKKIKLMLTSFINLQEICSHKSSNPELSRTISRLDEISSVEYVQDIQDIIAHS